MGATGKSQSGKRNGTPWGPVGRSCVVESFRWRLRAVNGAVARGGAYGCGEPLAESTSVPTPGSLAGGIAVGERRAFPTQALLAEARAKRLERIEGAVRVVNDVR